MLNRFFKDSIIYTIPVFFSKGIYILLLPLYVKILSVYELGILELFNNLGALIIAVLALEITQSVARFMPSVDSYKKKVYASTGLCFTVFTFLVGFFIINLFSNEITILSIENPLYETHFKLFLIYIFCYGMYYYFQNLLRFDNQSVQYTACSLIFAFTNLISTFILGVILNQGFLGILYSMIISSIISLTASFWFARRLIIFSFDKKSLNEMLFFALPLVPSATFVFISLYVDRFMLGKILDIESVGIYSVGIKLASVSTLLISGFQMAITPLIYKNFQSEQTKGDLSRIFKYFFVFYLIFYVSYSLLIDIVIYILASDTFIDARHLVPILFLAFMLSNIYVFFPGISIEKKTYIILITNFIVMILNIFFNILFINLYGIYGAALATTLGFFFGALIQCYFSQKFYYVKHAWIKYAIALGLTILIIFAFQIDYLVNNIELKLLTIMLFPVLFFVIKLLNFNEIIQLKNYLKTYILKKN